MTSAILSFLTICLESRISYTDVQLRVFCNPGVIWTFREKLCDRDVEGFDVVPLSQPAEDCGQTRTSGNTGTPFSLLDCCARRRTTQLVSLVSRTLLIGSVADHRSV